MSEWSMWPCSLIILMCNPPCITMAPSEDAISSMPDILFSSSLAFESELSIE